MSCEIENDPLSFTIDNSQSNSEPVSMCVRCQIEQSLLKLHASDRENTVTDAGEELFLSFFLPKL